MAPAEEISCRMKASLGPIEKGKEEGAILVTFLIVVTNCLTQATRVSVSFGSQFEGTVHHSGEVTVAGDGDR